MGITDRVQLVGHMRRDVVRVALRLVQLAEAAETVAGEFAERHAALSAGEPDGGSVTTAWALKREAEGRAEGYRHAYRLLAEVIPGEVGEVGLE
mgnify:CR=1 FL=1